MRLIDADILENMGYELHRTYRQDASTMVYEVKKIADVPTIEAEPVRHGRWLHGREVSRDYIGDACVAIHYEKWWCSKCNYTVDGEPLWNYCPNCGARMEAE
jgi:rubrerythrin